MTIGAINRADAVGNNSAVAFAYGFKIFAASELEVKVKKTSDGTITTLTYPTHYAVSGVGSSAGGNVTLVDVDGAWQNASDGTLKTGYTIAIRRVVPLTQSTDIRNQGGFYADVHEDEFDYLTMIAQQLKDDVDRSVKLDSAYATADFDMTLPAPVASGAIGFNADGDGLAIISDLTGVATTAFTLTLLDDANAAAARTTLDVLSVAEAIAAAGDTMTGPLVFSSGANPASELINGICEGRLTLTSGTPVTTADVLAAETLYFTPYKGNRIALTGASGWMLYQFSEISIDVPDATGMYDVFAYISAGAVVLELLAWTNDTTRATALYVQNGVLVKNGDATRRYLGSFYCTTAGNGQIEDSYAKRNLWNYYNRVVRPMKVVEATNSWAYTTAAFRQANGSSANQIEYVQGVSEDAVRAEVNGLASSDQTAYTAGAGIGVDSTTVNSAITNIPGYTNSGPGPFVFPRASYRGFPGVGRHLLTWLEYSVTTAGTTTWYGDNNAPTLYQSGIIGELLG